MRELMRDMRFLVVPLFFYGAVIAVAATPQPSISIREPVAGVLENPFTLDIGLDSPPDATIDPSTLQVHVSKVLVFNLFVPVPSAPVEQYLQKHLVRGRIYDGCLDVPAGRYNITISVRDTRHRLATITRALVVRDP